VTIPVRSFSILDLWDTFLPVTDPSFVAEADDRAIRREKARARELRQTQWWKRKRSSGVCHWCGGRFDPQILTMDHVVPLVRGGRSTKGNVVSSCKECNTKKSHRLAWE
jgi:5-methylcytosine-specific restriction endonuclease McrA